MKNKLYIFLGTIFIVLIFNLGSWGLTESSEARYATIAKEMVENNDYINPTLLEIKHFHKPPVTYYLTALGYKIFGINEFGARFFMQIALLIQIFLLFKITFLLYKNEKIAYAASLIYFTFPITLISIRNLTTDAYLTTFIIASIYFWLHYKKLHKKYLLYLFYISLGLIFETKGPVGLIIPITFIISYKILNKEKIETTIHQFLGFLLFLIVSSAWYIAVIYKNDHLFHYFFNNQLVERVAENKFKRGKPFWYYLLTMPLIGLPWLFFLFFYFKKNFKNILTTKKTEFVLLITFLILFLILSISTSKLILYVLPLYFIVAIFMAKYLSECTSKTIRLFSIIILSLTIILQTAVVVFSFIKNEISINPIYASIGAVLFISASFILLKFIKNSNFLKPAYLSIIFIISLLFTANHTFTLNELNINSVKPIAKFIQDKAHNNEEVYVYNYLLPSMSFYLNKKITTINHGRYTTQRETQFQKNDVWKEHFINYFKEEDRNRLLNTNTNNLFLIKRKKDILPDTLKIIQSKLKHKKVFDKYEIYY